MKDESRGKTRLFYYRGLMTGIYKITNKVNNKIYIGQSVNIANRWTEYYHMSVDAAAHSVICKAIIKYGLENFKFEVIEQCKRENLDEREIYWIAYYNSYVKGYNQTPGGGSLIGESNPNAKLTEVDIIFIRQLYLELLINIYLFTKRN